MLSTLWVAKSVQRVKSSCGSCKRDSRQPEIAGSFHTRCKLGMWFSVPRRSVWTLNPKLVRKEVVESTWELLWLEGSSRRGWFFALDSDCSGTQVLTGSQRSPFRPFVPASERATSTILFIVCTERFLPVFLSFFLCWVYCVRGWHVRPYICVHYCLGPIAPLPPSSSVAVWRVL